jgi:hypothetical protein
MVPPSVKACEIVLRIHPDGADLVRSERQAVYADGDPDPKTNRTNRCAPGRLPGIADEAIPEA